MQEASRAGWLLVRGVEVTCRPDETFHLACHVLALFGVRAVNESRGLRLVIISLQSLCDAHDG
jgi:hypothetical protein